MFDSLLGRKFTVKCKQAIKCINERLRLIRKRKQAMLNFLKQDIADLLRNGHDSHALNRMDALIVEMNHLACYDMIEKFCESILKQLSVLQKQRECPAEDRESVSTLIFAAARFSDLPELCDLRHAFMTRYGGALETSVNLEFIEKLASRTFLMATKVQLMQNIAQESSVKWDSESLEGGITDHVASQCVNENDGEKSDGMCEHSFNTVKDVVAETKDIHVIDHEPELTRLNKICDDELENVDPYPPDTSIPYYVQPKNNMDGNFMKDWQRKDGTYGSPRAREVLDPIDKEGKVLGEMKSEGDCRDGSKVPPVCNGELDGLDAEYWNDDNNINSRSSRARGKLENGTDGDDCHENDTTFKRPSKARMHHNGKRRHAVGRYEFEDNDRSTRGHHVDPKGIKDAADSDDNGEQASREHKFEDNDRPVKIPPYVKSKTIKDGVHSDDWGKDQTANGISAKVGKDADLDAQEGQSVGPWKSNHDRAYHMIPPPYVKPRVTALTDHGKSSSPPTNDGGFTASDKHRTRGYRDPQKDEVVNHGRPKPRSVRRINKKPPVVQDCDDAIDSDAPLPRIRPGQRKHAARTNTFSPQDDYDSDEEAIDRLLIHYSKKKPPHQSRKHNRERTQTQLADHAGDSCRVGQHQTSDEYNTDRPESPQTHLIEHFDGDETLQHQTDGSRQAYIHQSNGRDPIHKPVSAQSLSVDHMNHGEAGQHRTSRRHHIDKREVVHPPERAASFPPDPLNVEEKVKVPARAASMQPDALSPSSGLAHSKLPDYEEFAARFAALRRG